MTANLPFEELMRRPEGGDPEAAAEVFRLYAHRLIALARSRLESNCRAVLSGADVAQEALNSFFRRQRQDPYDRDSDAALWGLLAEITLRKCGKWNRRCAARKRAGVTLALQSAGDALQLCDALPTPEDAVVLAETLTELYGGLNDKERTICEPRLQGCQVREIAAQVDLAETTVSRKLGRIKDRLSRLCAAVE